MPDRTYVLNYDAQSAIAAAAAIDRLAASLTRVDALLDKVRPKLQGIGNNASRGLNNTTKASDALGVSLTGLQAKATTTGAALQGMGARTARVATTTESASSALGLFTARMIALQAARAGFQMVMQESQKLEEYWQRLAKEADTFRDSLRELASLKGKDGPDNNVTADVLDLALQTRMTADKAKSLAESYENFGPTVREKGHYQPTSGTPEQLEADILAETGKTARRLGIGEAEAGTALGSAGLFHKFTSKEEAMEQLGGAAKGLSEGSVKYSEGFKYLNVAAAKLVDTEEAGAEGSSPGKIGSFAEAGVLLGALSLGTGGSAATAGTRMLQLGRALNPKADNKKAIAALTLAGVQGKALPDQVTGLADYFKREGITNPTAWMQQNNVGTISPAQREAVESMTKIADVFKERLGRQRESSRTNATGRSTIAANTNFMAKDRSASASGVDSVRDVMDKTLGIEGSSDFEQAKKAAEERMRLNDPGYHSRWRGIRQTIAAPFDYAVMGVGGPGYQQEADPRYGALAQLRASGRGVGVDVDKISPDLEASNYQTRARAFKAAADAVRAKGGDPIGLGQLQSQARERVRATREGGGIGGPQPANGGAVVDPNLVRVNEKQLDVLIDVKRLLGGGNAAPNNLVMRGPLPIDGGEVTPRRR